MGKKKVPEGTLGWKIGLEPTTYGTTIHRSNLLSYNHHLNWYAKVKQAFHMTKSNLKKNYFFLYFISCWWSSFTLFQLMTFQKLDT